jgi:hypothetical protein
MAKDKISDYSSTANSNTDIAGINIDEGCAPSGINDAIRTLMAQLKTWQSGGQDVYIHPAGTASAPSVTANGDTNTGVFFPAADTVAVTTGGSERVRVDSSGNLGLGVTPSAWQSGRKAFQVGYSSMNSYSNSQIQLGANFYYDGTNNKYISSDYSTVYQQLSGQHQWYTSASGTAGGTITFTQAMTLTSSGYLGIGTTSPGDRLTIANSASGGSAAATFWGNNGNSSNELYIGQGSANEAYVFNRANQFLVFGTANTERARIDSSGNLLVGTTSGSKHILKKDNNNNEAVQFENSNTSSPYGGLFFLSGASPNNSTNYFLTCVDGGITTRATIRSNGGLANYSGNNVNLSDRREKTNFAPAGDYLSKICAIPVQTFNYIDQNLEEDDGLTLGVVAQDVQAVAPELVLESNWAGKDEEPKMRLSIYQTDLQYALMKSIQELKAIVDAQAAEIAALKGNA